MKVLILTADSNGGYPVPAVKGGAVSTLIEHLVAGNNKKQLCDMEIVSLYDIDAEKRAVEQYPNVKFTWVKVPGILKFLDKCAFNFIRVVRKNEKAISFRSPFTLLWYIYKVKRLVNRVDADKIVLENNILLVRVMKGSKYTGEWYYHFHNVPRIDAGCRDELQKITKFLCVSQFVADQITTESSPIGRIDPEKIAVLYNCVDTGLFRPLDKSNPIIIKLRKKYEFSKEDFICIFTGRLSEEKGVDKVLESIQNAGDNVKCIIVGSLFFDFNVMTDYQKKIYALAENIKNRVIFTGYISQDEIPYYYNLANVAILPSMWDEPAGLTNIEAMACGLPVITTYSGGIPEYVDGCGKILIRNDQLIQKMSESINELKLSSTCYKSETSVKHVSEKFSNENYLERFLLTLK